ncbi:MAG: hypothetical protein KGL39_58590 [Patescibacteria group bacterium]|nr:hypothetical protein [Patescibacteria group bacterium]
MEGDELKTAVHHLQDAEASLRAAAEAFLQQGKYDHATNAFVSITRVYHQIAVLGKEANALPARFTLGHPN